MAFSFSLSIIMNDERKKIIIFVEGEKRWCYEDEIYDPPEPLKPKTRENYKAYNEEESDKNRSD